MQEVSTAARRQSILIKAVTRALRFAFGVGARVMFRGSVERKPSAYISRLQRAVDTAGCFTQNVFLDCMILLHLCPCSSAACVEAVDRTCFAQSACSGSTCRGTRGRARHASAAPTRRALPVAQSIRLALRLHALAPKVAGPDHRCWRLLSLTPRRGRSIRLRAPTSRAGGHRRVLPRCFDMRGVEEVPGEVGAQRELEAAHGRQCPLSQPVLEQNLTNSEKEAMALIVCADLVQKPPERGWQVLLRRPGSVSAV